MLLAVKLPEHINDTNLEEKKHLCDLLQNFD